LSFLRSRITTYSWGEATGTVLAGCTTARSRVQSRRHHRRHFAGILGEKYLDTIYDAAWVEEFIVPEDSGQCQDYALLRLSEAQIYAFDRLALTVVPWRKLVPIDLSALARVGELIEPISGKQDVSRA